VFVEGMKLPNDLVARAVGEFDGLELGDPRREARLRQVVAKVARRPTASMPVALGREAEVQGAYRLMNNEHVSFEALLDAHSDKTRQRAETAQRVLVVHDTTDCSFPHLDPEEIGYLQTGKAGFLLHLSLVLDASNGQRRPLGVIHAQPLFRSKRSRRGSRKRKVSGHETATWSDREYTRWWRGMEATAETLRGCEQVIHVADREGDSYDLMARLVMAQQSFVIRVRVDRRARQTGTPAAEWASVKQVAALCAGTMEREVALSARGIKSAPGMNRSHPPRKARIATLRFSATTVEIPRPRYLGDEFPETLKLNLVHVLETNPPPGQPPVEWMLYTTEPIDTDRHVALIVDTYRARWTIEEFNGALKTGCAYEAREFESRSALLNLLAISLPIACEALWLRSRARSAPGAPATEVLSALQIQILRTLASRKMSQNPTVHEALLAVASLGGHLKTNGPPGWKVLQRAMADLLAYEIGWTAALSHAAQTCD
jgi:hypothetical protein